MARSDSSLPLTFMTYNVRYDTPHDGTDQWVHRRADVASLIAKHRPLVFGLQEPLEHQVRDIEHGLEMAGQGQYRWVGRGRNADGSSEFNPIFFDATQLNLVVSGTFWLSESPDEPGSKHAKASLPRICTWCCFEGEGRGRFFVFNTHLDHIAASAREYSAHLLLDRISSIAGLYPAILCGDFNSQPSSGPHRIITSSFLSDSFTECDEAARSDEKRWTFTGFGREQRLVIDYVLVSGFDVLSYTEDRTPRVNGRMCSDHSPVVVTLCNRYV